jgi:hypothetical protein
MFTSFDTIVDTVQGAQKSFVETYVSDKKIQTELVKMTEAQAKFAKGIYQTSLSVAQAAFKSATDLTSKKAD